MAKADHMLAILLLLQSRKRMTARQLAEEVEIHIRSVYRYIDALCMSGVPIISETGRDGGYYIPDGFKLEPLFFDMEEQKSLLHAAQFARDSGYPLEEALNRAIAKIKRYARADQYERLLESEKGLGVIHPPAASEKRSTLEKLEKAMGDRQRIELHYHADYEGHPTVRQFDPYGIVNWKDKWYAVGYCHLRNDIRHFRVDRIAAIRLTDARYDRPEDFSPRESMLSSLLPGATSGGDDEWVTVRIEGLPQALDDLCSHWLFAHALVDRTVSEAIFRIDEHHLYVHAPYYLLSYGGKIRVMHPPELRECMAEIAESMAQYYRN